MAEIGMLICVFAWIIYFVCYLSQHTKSSESTKDFYNMAKNLDQLTYYDYNSKCVRYVETGEKCVKLEGFDVDGKIFEYVFTKPVIGEGKVKGIRYFNPNDRDKEVKISPKQLESWKEKGWID